jgi:Uma2 family endonuclease
MSVAFGPFPTVRAPVPVEGKLFTIADLDALPQEVPSGPADYELDNGVLITTGPPVLLQSIAQTNLLYQLTLQGSDRGLGSARLRVGIVLWRNPDRLVSPAASFILKRSLPPQLSPEGFLARVPELVVEITSQYTSIPYLERKVSDYLVAGAQAVLVADPVKNTIVVYRSASDPQMFGEEAELIVEDVLPGFRCPVAELFNPGY